MAELDVLTHNKSSKRKISRGGNVLAGCLRAIAGFFIAMAVPYGGMAPLGISFLAQERRLSAGTFLCFSVASIGSLVVCERADATKYIAAGLLYLAVLFVLERDVVPDVMAASIISAVCVFFTGLVVVYWTGFSVRKLIMLFAEAGLTALGTYVFDCVYRVLRVNRFTYDRLTSKEKICIAAAAVLVVLGMKDIKIGSDFSVMDMAAAVLMLEVALGCGITFSTGAGVVLGVACGIDTNFFMPVLGAFSFCGFLSGILSKYGKGGVMAGLVAANILLSLYNNGAMRAMLSFYEVMAAAVVFVLLPSGFTDFVKNIVAADEQEKEAVSRLKEGIRIKLKSVSASFEEMSQTLERLSDREEVKKDDDIAGVFDLAADRVCKNCRKSDACWNKEPDFTYKALLKLMKAMEEKGGVDVEDADGKFRRKCLKLPELVTEINHQSDVQRMRCVWKSRLKESRELVGEQLLGMSEIIENISDEIGSMGADSRFSRNELSRKFEEAGINVRDINIFQDSNGRYRVGIILRSFYWKDKPKSEIMKIIRDIYDSEVSVQDMLFDEGEFVKIEFSEAKRFRVETDFASKAASEQNGDNYRFSHIADGKYVIALSDGMGTGSRAARESEAMLELLDSFLRAGFDSRMAIRFINSIMLLKSEEEAFVTIDICIIDLYTGAAEFIKTGAEPSFVMCGNYVDTVKAGSLPAGIVTHMEARSSTRTVGSDTVIVMVSDGLEIRENGSIGWVGDYIGELRRSNQENNLAEKILRTAIEKNNGAVNDDMTVLSVKLKDVG